MPERNIPAGPPMGGAPLAPGPAWPWMVLGAVGGAAFCAFDWASASHPTKPLATLLRDQAWGLGYFVLASVLAGMLANWRRPFRGLLLPFALVPFYLVGLVPAVVSSITSWGGGWGLGSAGAAAGAAAGTATGWLFSRWTLQESQNPQVIVSGTLKLPGAFAVLFALFGAFSWATAWIATLGEAWVIGLFPLSFALLGALVRKPLLGLLAALPLVPVQLVPLVASLTAGWEGGWPLGMVGAAAGAAAGAATGWLYGRWIMPEYEKRRARAHATRPAGAIDGPGSRNR